MALAATLWSLEADRTLRLENYASFLSHTPPVEDLTLVEPSSWSCVHGVDRWRRECGCKMAPHLESQQAWRGVLRAALEELAGELHALYRLDGGRLLRSDPETGPNCGRQVAPLEQRRGVLAQRAGQDLETLLDGIGVRQHHPDLVTYAADTAGRHREIVDSRPAPQRAHRQARLCGQVRERLEHLLRLHAQAPP